MDSPGAHWKLGKLAAERRLGSTGIARACGNNNTLDEFSGNRARRLIMKPGIFNGTTYASVRANAGTIMPESKTAATRASRDLKNIVKVICREIRCREESKNSNRMR